MPLVYPIFHGHIPWQTKQNRLAQALWLQTNTVKLIFIIRLLEFSDNFIVHINMNAICNHKIIRKFFPCKLIEAIKITVAGELVSLQRFQDIALIYDNIKSDFLLVFFTF